VADPGRRQARQPFSSATIVTHSQHIPGGTTQVGAGFAHFNRRAPASRARIFKHGGIMSKDRIAEKRFAEDPEHREVVLGLRGWIEPPASGQSSLPAATVYLTTKR